MAGQVQIKLGDMFHGACDLIVLPCSTIGSVTAFVDERLKHYNIPEPPSSELELGDLYLLPFQGGENIAQYVAFAVSVHYGASSLYAIEIIGKGLGELTLRNPAIQIMHVPLLGAGAGRLQSEKVVEALKKGFEAGSADNSTLIVHVLHESVFTRVINYFNTAKKIAEPIPAATETARKPMRVFISWTRSNDAHHEWTEALARFLRENGINARIDLWHLRHGMDLPQFMANELSLSDKVIIISNEQYAAKADGRTGGVGWETMIIQGDMSRLPPDSIKYITIVRCDDIDKGLPLYLKTKYVIHWPSGTNEAVSRKRLLDELLNIIEEPPIGVPVAFV